MLAATEGAITVDTDQRSRTTTEEHSRPSREQHDIVITERTLRLIIIIVLLIAAAGTLFYVMLRIRATYPMQQDIAELKAWQEAHDADEKAYRTQMAAEVTALKATLYEPRPSKTTRPSVVELWQKNRDAEIQKRLRALEQWRYRMDER